MNALKTIVPENYGYVILTFVATQLLLVWMSMKVGKARKKYNVQVSADPSLCFAPLSRSSLCACTRPVPHDVRERE